MHLNLISCSATRPDRRAIVQLFEEIVIGADKSLAQELMEILLDGSPVDIEVNDKKSGSALRGLRKYDIDYEIID